MYSLNLMWTFVIQINGDWYPVYIIYPFVDWSKISSDFSSFQRDRGRYFSYSSYTRPLKIQTMYRTWFFTSLKIIKSPSSQISDWQIPYTPLSSVHISEYNEPHLYPGCFTRICIIWITIFFSVVMCIYVYGKTNIPGGKTFTEKRCGKNKSIGILNTLDRLASPNKSFLSEGILI